MKFTDILFLDSALLNYFSSSLTLQTNKLLCSPPQVFSD
jgi:hypothetical protein